MIDLRQGDCLEVMKEIPDKSVDMILCDLPYHITQNDWDIEIPLFELFGKYNRIIKDNGAIVLFAGGLFTYLLIESSFDFDVDWRYNLVWKKTTPTGFLNANRQPLRIHEDICVFYKKQPTYHPQKTIGHKRKVSTAKHKENCKKTTNYGEHKLRHTTARKDSPQAFWNLRQINKNLPCILHRNPLLSWNIL